MRMDKKRESPVGFRSASQKLSKAMFFISAPKGGQQNINKIELRAGPKAYLETNNPRAINKFIYDRFGLSSIVSDYGMKA